MFVCTTAVQAAKGGFYSTVLADMSHCMYVHLHSDIVLCMVMLHMLSGTALCVLSLTSMPLFHPCNCMFAALLKGAVMCNRGAAACNI
jgi:hypothetical protein